MNPSGEAKLNRRQPPFVHLNVSRNPDLVADLLHFNRAKLHPDALHSLRCELNRSHGFFITVASGRDLRSTPRWRTHRLVFPHLRK